MTRTTFGSFLILLVAGCGRAPAIPMPDVNGVELQVRAAILSCQEALKSSLDSGSAWGRYGIILHAHGFLEDAARAYARAAELEPAEFRWPYFLGILRERNDAEAALRCLETAAKIDPHYAALMIRRARLLVSLNRFDEAAAQLSQAEAIAPDDPSALQTRAALALQRGDAATAVASLERAAAVAPSSGAVQASLAHALRRAGDVHGAHRAAERARVLSSEPLALHDPRYAEVISAAANVAGVLDRSETARLRGDLDAALREVETALRLSPDDPYAHAAGARIYGLLGRHEDAVRAAKRAIALHPELPDGLTLLVLSLFALDRLDEADAQAAVALSRDPDNAEMLYVRGLVQARKAAFDRAAVFLRRAALLAPHDAAIHAAYVQTLLDGDRPADAVKALWELLQRHPGDFEAQLLLVWLLAASPDVAVRNGDEAVRLAEALAATPFGRRPDARDALAAAYAEARRFEDAVRVLEDLLTEAREARVPRAHMAPFRERLDLYRAGKPFRRNP